MPEASEKILAQLKALRERYAADLPKKIAELRRGFDALRGANPNANPGASPGATPDTPQREAWRTLHRQVHSITGSGGTFGYLDLSAATRVLEQALKPLSDSADAMPAEQFATLDLMLIAVEQAATAAVCEQETPKLPPLRPTNTSDPERLIFVVDDDTALAREQRLQYELHGYQVREFHSFENLGPAIAAAKPRAIIMDIMFPDGDIAGIQKIAELRALLPQLPPVVFVSSREDLETRLESVRAGAAAYFIKPLDFSELIETLDRLTANERNPGYRVLIVDDDESLAQHNTLILEGAGMRVRMLTDPTNILEVLPGFRPDLILMDLYLPQCNGIELAAVIRQHEAYVGTPIVFFSVETDVTKHLDAMRVGGDDFLIKPITPAHLIATVEARARRARAITALMVRDSLTGLLNHANIEEQLLRELGLRARQGGALSYALIDLDHFKQVNDQYGHAAGDRVLRGLSRLLRQRFRQTDLIGRYGGEEFVVVFPNTDVKTATRLIDSVRDAFSRIKFQLADKSFHVTFSAGMAGAPPFTDASTLQSEADRALYRAKAAGRNQIVVAEPLAQSA